MTSYDFSNNSAELCDIHAAVEKAIADGQTFETFRKELTPKLQEKGWWGGIDVPDPAGGTKAVHVGPRRLRTIFQTNIRMAYSAGQWQRVQRLKAARPYLRYLTVNDDRVRRQHRAWHNVVLKVDDPWWDTHWPPNGWGCRCIVQQLSGRDVEKLKLEVLQKGPEGLPRRFLNRRTGAVEEVPEGISPGFAYNAGKASAAANAGRQLVERLAVLPPDIAARAYEASRNFVLSGISSDFVNWARQVIAGEIRTGGLRVIGALPPALMPELERLGFEPQSAAIAIRDQDLLHLRVRRKAEDAKAISDLDLLRLPQLLAAPVAILHDRVKDNLVYVFDAEDIGRDGKLIVEIDFRDKTQKSSDGLRRRITINMVRSAGLVSRNTLTDNKTYELLAGNLD